MVGMFRLTLSNRSEYLLDRLLERLTAERTEVFTPQQVIVPSAALRRRVELVSADHIGVCANIEFSFLAQWLWARIGQLVPVQERSPFTPSLLSWRVYEIFGDERFTGRHPRLDRYLHQADAVMRLDLAQRVTETFEHYSTYRPEWLAAWSLSQSVIAASQGLPADLAADKREDEAWQADLWRRITHQLGLHQQHPSVAFFEKVAALGADAALLSGLPAVAHVFCLPAIPPLYLNILRHLSRWIDINVYAINPCQEYWFEIIDPKRLSYLTRGHGARHHEVGNTLLATWGKQTQAHLGLLFADEGIIVEEGSAFIATGRASLLAQLQDAILHMEELAPASVSLANGDRSVEVHVCHSFTREVEVLHNRLLELLADESSLLPQDILVVTPDLRKAAPIIDMVFGTAPAARRIPYVITGQPETEVNPVALLLDSLFSLCAGRLLASAVFSLLQQELVMERFGFDRSSLAQIYQWIQQSGICWGWDAEQRRDLGLPESAHHSFSDGMNRLFLSYALGDSAADTVLYDCLPAANPEGMAAVLLGRFWRFLESVNGLRREWSQPLRPEEWQRSLNNALGLFVPDSLPWVDDLRVVQSAIGRLCRNMAEGGACSVLPLDLVRRVLTNELDDPTRGGMPTGVVTVASMASLRSLSYRVICLVGMDDMAFPDSQHPPEFDLMAIAPQRGDQQRRTDSRNLFLDLLMAAREHVHISYRGRNARDNSPIPPSVLVAELLDYLSVATAIPHEAESEEDALARARKRLMVYHPLQAFSVSYFLVPGDDARLRSYHAEYCEALRQRLGQPDNWQDIVTEPPSFREELWEDEVVYDDELVVDDAGRTRFFVGPLSPPPEELRNVSLEQLERFFCNPGRVLLRQRLDIRLVSAEELLKDDEPFLYEYTGRQAMAERLLPTLLAKGKVTSDLFALALAGHEFPQGLVGKRLLEEELRHLEAFATRLTADLAAPALDPVRQVLTFEIAGEVWQLSGALVDVRESGLIRYRYDDTRPTDYLAGWITHLFLCAVAMSTGNRAYQTKWHSRNGSFLLNPCENALDELGRLVALYRQGLMQPLHFFPKSAWAYRMSDDLKKGYAQWRNVRDSTWSECADLNYRLILRGVPDPLDADFCGIASVVFDPLLRCLDDPRHSSAEASEEVEEDA